MTAGSTLLIGSWEDSELREQSFTGPLPFFMGAAGRLRAGTEAEARGGKGRSQHRLCTNPKAVHKCGDRIEIVHKTRRTRISLISYALRRTRKSMPGAPSGTGSSVESHNRLILDVFPGTPKPDFSDTNRSIEINISIFISGVQGVREMPLKTSVVGRAGVTSKRRCDCSG
jgi:hypothetical protein